MAGASKIEWTEATWNPVRGCTRVSEGCRNCYAERVAARFAGSGLPYEGLATGSGATSRWTGKLAFSEKALLEPLRRRKPTMYFVNSMSDLFHERMPEEWIDQVFAVMALCPQHTFQVLTKRPERMRAYLCDRDAHNRVSLAGVDAWLRATFKGRGAPPNGHISFIRREGRDVPTGPWPLPNVWCGTSVEDQATADTRIPDLLATPAHVRFVSAEPLLGPVDLTRIRSAVAIETIAPRLYEAGGVCSEISQSDRIAALDWVIAGGESGRAARPMHPDWARAIRDQCAATGVPFFFKQHGEFLHRSTHPNGNHPLAQAAFDSNEFIRVGKKAAGRLLDGIEHNGMPPSIPRPVTPSPLPAGGT